MGGSSPEGGGRHAEVARRFIDAFNRRDVEAMIALADEEVEFSPIALIGVRQVYRGHDGLRQWIADLERAAGEESYRHQVLKVREIDGDRVAVITRLVVREAVTSSALVVHLNDGKVVAGRAYLSDEALLERIGVLPPGG